MKSKIVLITSFYESPFHKNRAPYNEQLFFELKEEYDIQIIRPIAWTDIHTANEKLRKQEYYKKYWHSIPIFYPTYYFIPRIALPTNGRMYYLSILNTFRKMKVNPDLFYTTWAYPDAFATMLLARKYNKKYILRVHGSDINDLAYRKEIQKKVQNVLLNASAIISPSQALKEKMVALGVPKRKIHVIYSGVDTRIFFPENKNQCEKKLGLTSGKKRILYIGNFKIAKGVFDLLKVAKILAGILDNLEILFIGKGEERANMQNFIKEHGLEQIVKIIGSVDHHLLNPWINSADCVCLPSYAEGLPNVLLEALACKTSIVATSVGGIPEIIKDSENYLVSPADIANLKNKLLGVLTEKIKPAEAAIKIENYKSISDRISQIIKRVIET